jgi:hypothetical protein
LASVLKTRRFDWPRARTACASCASTDRHQTSASLELRGNTVVLGSVTHFCTRDLDLLQTANNLRRRALSRRGGRLVRLEAQRAPLNRRKILEEALEHAAAARRGGRCGRGRGCGSGNGRLEQIVDLFVVDLRVCRREYE